MSKTSGTSSLVKYDQKAIEEVQVYETRQGGWFSAFTETAMKPINQIMSVPGVSMALEKTVGKAIEQLNDIAAKTVWQTKIYEEYRQASFDVTCPEDIKKLRLRDVEVTLGQLKAKYVGLAAAEGAATGVTGVPGVVADIPAFVLLGLRAIGEYATYYGFDVEDSREVQQILKIMNLAMTSDFASKQTLIVGINKMAKAAATNYFFRDAAQKAAIKSLKSSLKSIGIKVADKKLAQFLPLVGAPIGAAINANLMADICTAAKMEYRKRFLDEQYPEENIIPKIDDSELEAEDELGPEEFNNE